MTGRTGTIRAKAFFSVKKMDKEGGKEKEGKNAQEKEAAFALAHLFFGL